MSPAIYFIECCERVKVGYSTNAPRRIAGLGNTCPFPCKTLAIIPGTEAQEQQVHKLLQASRRNGEWFERTQEIENVLTAVIGGNLADGAALVEFLGGHISHPIAGTFDEILSFWETPKALSADLGVPYINAQAMKRRKSIGVDHWPKIIGLLAKRGITITNDDLVRMTLKRREAA